MDNAPAVSAPAGDPPASGTDPNTALAIPSRAQLQRAARLRAAVAGEGPFSYKPEDLALPDWLDKRWGQVATYLNCLSAGATNREAADACGATTGIVNTWLYRSSVVSVLARKARELASFSLADDLQEFADRLPDAGQTEIRGLAEAARIKQWLAEAQNPEAFSRQPTKAAVAITINTNLDLKGTTATAVSSDVLELGGGYTVEAIVPADPSQHTLADQDKARDLKIRARTAKRSKRHYKMEARKQKKDPAGE